MNDRQKNRLYPLETYLGLRESNKKKVVGLYRFTVYQTISRPSKVDEGNQTISRPSKVDEGNQTISRPSKVDEGNQTISRPSKVDEGNQTISRPSKVDEGNQTISRPSKVDEGIKLDIANICDFIDNIILICYTF